ncbi:oligosaccharide flippase family protein [Weissella viridescens]|uniref:polysaccharide biosynthesis protein n=1 Tax=Weissella viridescens TaxID=1629 RepID=UPI001D081F26|nr:polysaccharide biosynthesis protein [Weissella viridescens]MCB6840194.1 oligosaccharide flippase family protein [Weissella viridescens]MCB6846926.1 oligosaccharide flippase family protein [Weissella viridescens]
MADDKNEQNDDPFRGHLTMDELQALMSGEKTVDEIFAERDNQSENTPEDIMTEDAKVPEAKEDENNESTLPMDGVVPENTVTEADPPQKIEVKDDTEIINDHDGFEIHEMGDPFQGDSEVVDETPEVAPKDDVTPSKAASETVEVSPETTEESDVVAAEIETFEEIKPEPLNDDEDAFIEPQFTEPEPPTYYAGANFVDQAGGLGATTVVPVQNTESDVVSEKETEQTEAEEKLPEGVELLQPEDTVTEAEEDADTSSRMLRGSFWMTAGSLASRLLGALYVIPWMAMLGYTYANQANAVYGQGYQIYSLALMVATAGLPNVLARLVAEYASQKHFARVQQVFKQSLLLGGIMGIIAGGAIFIFATPLGQGDPHVARVIRSLAPAVLIIPALAMMRGYMQGFEFMGPSALSQFVEQVIRVAYMLGMTYWIMIGHHGNWVDATVQSTFAAFWGALAGIVVLIIAMIRKRRFFAEEAANQVPAEPIDTMSLIGKMVRQSIPVILAGSAIAILQLIDQYTFGNIMKRFTDFSNLAITNMFAQFAVNSNKLVMLVVSLAVGMAETTLPMLARAREIGSRENISHQIQYAFKLLSFILIPAALGMAAIARPLYLLFYTANDAHNGTLVLQYASFTAIVLGLYMVVLAIYQGLSQLRYTVKMLVVILVVKLVLQFPAIMLFDGMGPLVSTLLAFAVGLVFAIRRLTREFNIDWRRFNYSLITILFWSLIMYVVASLVSSGLSAVMPSGKLSQLFIVIIAGGLGAAIYGIAALKTSIGEEVLGPRVKRLADKLPF